MAIDRAKMLEDLVSKGMSPEEAKNFLNSKVGIVKMQLPPSSALKVLTALSKVCVVSMPMEVTFMVAENRIQTLGDLAQEAAGQRILNAMIPPDALIC